MIDKKFNNIVRLRVRVDEETDNFITNSIFEKLQLIQITDRFKFNNNTEFTLVLCKIEEE